MIWLVVGADGKSSSIKVNRGVGHGLDEEAIEAVKRWKSEPATLNGQPVPVMINVEVNFRLYGKPGEQTASPPSPALGARQDANTLFVNASSAHAMNDGDLVFDLAGNLYGNTSQGSSCSQYLQFCGTVFELTPSGKGWTETVLYVFQGQDDGSFPNSLSIDQSGNLYATTEEGGGG